MTPATLSILQLRLFEAMNIESSLLWILVYYKKEGYKNYLSMNSTDTPNAFDMVVILTVL